MAATRPHVVIVTATVHSLGASLFAYALAPSLGGRRDVFRASSDPLSPLLRNYLRYERTGSISSRYHPNEVSYGYPGPLASDVGGICSAARNLGSDTILWDVSGPATAAITGEQWRDLAAAFDDPANVTVFAIAGLTQWSKRYLGLIASAFPRTVAVANLLLGRPENFPRDYPIATLPALDATAIRAIDSHPEPLDELSRKATLTTAERASLSVLADAVSDAKRFLPNYGKDPL